MLKRVIDIPTYEGYCNEAMSDECKAMSDDFAHCSLLIAHCLLKTGLTLFYFDVFGLISMEDFKRVYPEELGVLIGRSYSPSLFTLRCFLHRVRELQRGERLIEEFAVEYLKSGIARWGVLYIDGHFLPYYGVYPITKGWHGVRQIPMKSSYNFLGVDDKFNPWIFLVRSSSEDLLQKIPEIVEKTEISGRKRV